MTSDINS